MPHEQAPRATKESMRLRKERSSRAKALRLERVWLVGGTERPVWMQLFPHRPGGPNAFGGHMPDALIPILALRNMHPGNSLFLPSPETQLPLTFGRRLIDKKSRLVETRPQALRGGPWPCPRAGWENPETGASGSWLCGCLPVPPARLAQVPRHVPASTRWGPHPGRRSLPKRR